MTLEVKPKRQTAKHAPHVQQPVEAAQNPDALLRLSTAATIIGGGVSTVYTLAKNDPDFPILIKMGARCTRIRAGGLTDWLQRKAAKAEQDAAAARKAQSAQVIGSKVSS